MAAIIDEFSFNHPQNQGYSKSKRLVLLPQSDPSYVMLEKGFLKGWKHPNKQKPAVHAIFKILSSETSLKPFHQYRARVATHPSLNAQKKNPANEQLLFHGTNRCCLLVEDGHRVRLCDLSQCHLCCVIRNSFDVTKCGTKHKFRRFGNGIYTTACSSKADDYTNNADNNCNLRVLLVNRVIVGKPHKRRQNATNLTEPPCGHHSVSMFSSQTHPCLLVQVIGEPGVDLNYEETVVYSNDAIRPAYLVVYGDEPPRTQSKMQTLIKTLFKTPLAQ
ncbi:hypothetical protein K443DRAFT_133580 [Laccaria amethystina LaAM-08-1]|uniref:Poly [ADP-ribose] polymerase n=1 Tax=Laccaria amethystina LaAM-08-1 TaxID=1095629 RepID=A0A0C9XKK1_9AGAR|nr:hypothetical protein K443DRAFT_133580 [Laccaria amethystina LaAM-08-1]